MSFKIGIDIGGTKIAACLLDEQNKLLKDIKEATPDNYNALLSLLGQIIAGFQNTAADASIGMCYPGSINPETGAVHNANIKWLNSTHFETDLSELIKQSINTANDANCFTLAEATIGAGKDSKIVFGATMGTGLGGGLVINRELIIGAHGVAAEWGHTGLPRMTKEEAPGPDCYCGNQGCLESYLSGTGLSRSYRHQTALKRSGEEIVALAEQGDKAACIALEKFENRLARAIANIINTIDPDIFILGGGLSSIKRLYQHVAAQVEPFVFSGTNVNTPIVQAKLGNNAGMIGAALL